jgi:iron complex outermembrane receptor protein
LHLAILALLSGAAHAESADPAVPADQSSGNATSKEVVDLGNITVTAQSRTQEAQSVPIAVQIVTQKQIDALAATDLSRMNGYVPSLYVDGSQATQPIFSLRGISNSDFGIGTDAPVGIYEDGVFTGKTGGSLLTFNDIERIEVLKGPQGTLFGRNSAAGAISIITKDPIDAYEAGATVRLGNYGEKYGNALLNLPLGKDLAFRFSLVDNQSNGWFRDAGTGEHFGKNDDWGTRASLRWNAPAETTVRLAWEHEELNQPNRPITGIVPLQPAPYLPPVPPDPATFLNPLKAPSYTDGIDDREKRHFDGVTLRVEHGFGFADFNSTTSYRHFSTMNRGDTDGTNRIYLYFDTNNIEQNTSWYQEFKLAGKTDLADWVGGLSYYRDNARQESQLNFFTDTIDTLLYNTQGFKLYGPLSQAFQANGFNYSLLGDPWRESMFNHGQYKAYAAYGDVIWHISDRINLTTGVRFTRDEKEFSWYNPPRTADELDKTLAALQVFGLLNAAGVPIGVFQQNIEFTTPAATLAPVTFNHSWNDTSPRVVLDYKLADNQMLYASVAKGYEAGGYNSVQVGAVYEPETVWNYEFGLKSYLPDYRLLLNASVYYYKYSNLQTLTLVANGNGTLPLYIVTTSDRDAKGLDLEAHWQATDALRLNLTGAYINSQYKKYVTPDGADLSGQTTGEPKWQMALGLDYMIHDVAGGDVDLIAQHAYKSKAGCNNNSRAQGECIDTPAFKLGEAQNRTDLRASWSSRDVPWSVAVFVNNAFNKRYVTGINNISATVLGTPYAYISPPRFWGVEASVHF